MLRKLLWCLLSLMMIQIGYSQSFNTDFVRYVNEDGTSYKEYTKVESLGFNSWHFIEKGKLPEDVYSFISPSDYEIIPLLDEGYNQIQFSARQLFTDQRRHHVKGTGD